MTKKTKVFLCIGAIVGVVAVSGIFAYLTDTETAENKFTVGNVDIELKEPTWDAATDSNENDIPDYAENIVANQTVAKDPKVKNVGKNKAYVYLKVKVPKENIITAAADGTINNSGESANTPLFTFTPNTTDWTEITSAKVDVNGYVEYVYYYKEAIDPNEETSTLFDSVTFANIVDGVANPDSIREIDVNAYAIQSDNLPSGTTIEGAYQIYVNQNPN